MDSPPANVRRHFLAWDQPLLKQAVAFLAGEWDGRGPLDLSRLLVVVPTRQSGRRLREALAGAGLEQEAEVMRRLPQLYERYVCNVAPVPAAALAATALTWASRPS